MPSRHDFDARLLGAALLASVLLHALVLFSDRWNLNSLDPRQRFVLQASLQRTLPPGALPVEKPARAAGAERAPPRAARDPRTTACPVAPRPPGVPSEAVAQASAR